MRRALIDKKGLVVNVIEILPDSEWKAPKGCKLLSEEDSELASPGDTWDGSKIVPHTPEAKVEARDLAFEIKDIKERLTAAGL